MSSERSRGYYSLIQYCPDPSRLEALNVGVLLFCPSLQFLQVKMEQTHQRIQRLFGKQDWAFIERQKSAIRGRIEADRSSFRSLEDLNAYIEKRANAIQLSVARPVAVVEPAAELERLYGRLVAGCDAKQVGKRPSINRQLASVFQSRGVSGLLRSSVEIEVPALRRSVHAPYGYQNGRFNLIEPMQFDGVSSEGVFSKASKQAVEGQFVYEHQDPAFGPLRMIVVANFGAEQADEAATVRRIFDRHSVGLYTFGELDPLVADIKKSATDHRG